MQATKFLKNRSPAIVAPFRIWSRRQYLANDLIFLSSSQTVCRNLNNSVPRHFTYSFYNDVTKVQEKFLFSGATGGGDFIKTQNSRILNKEQRLIACLAQWRIITTLKNIGKQQDFGDTSAFHQPLH